MEIRDERAGDIIAIARLTTLAFESAAHSSGTEAAIVGALRNAGALALSLVASERGKILGHVAFSAVRIDGRAGHWFGLGPVSVDPAVQGKGIGTALIRAALDRLKSMGAEGCVVLGDPAYYGRFGFVSDPDLVYTNAPPLSFQRLVLAGHPPKGEITYHNAFNAS